MTDPLAPPPTYGPDSFTHGLATAATSRRGQGILKAAVPWVLGALFSALTAVTGWAGGKLTTKAELQEAIALRRESLAHNALDAERHAQVLHAIAELKTELVNPDLQAPGRVVRIERGAYFAWRALAEVRAFALAAQPARSRAAKELQGGKFARSFENRYDGRESHAVFDELFAQVAVP